METIFIIKITISSSADIHLIFSILIFVLLFCLQWWGVTLSKQIWAAQNVLVKLT